MRNKSILLLAAVPALALMITQFSYSETEDSQQGIYQDAMTKIQDSQTLEGIKLLAEIPDYKDSELYLQGYEAIEPLLGEWKGNMDEEFDQEGKNDVPTAFDIKFDDSNFFLQYRSSGDEKDYYNAYFTADATYSYTDNGKKLTDEYQGVAFASFSTDGEIENRGVAGLNENGFNIQLIYEEDGSCTIQFGYYDEKGELDTDTYSIFHGERVGDRIENGIKWDKTSSFSSTSSTENDLGTNERKLVEDSSFYKSFISALDTTGYDYHIYYNETDRRVYLYFAIGNSRETIKKYVSTEKWDNVVNSLLSSMQVLRAGINLPDDDSGKKFGCTTELVDFLNDDDFYSSEEVLAIISEDGIQFDFMDDDTTSGTSSLETYPNTDIIKAENIITEDILDSNGDLSQGGDYMIYSYTVKTEYDQRKAFNEYSDYLNGILQYEGASGNKMNFKTKDNHTVSVYMITILDSYMVNVRFDASQINGS